MASRSRGDEIDMLVATCSTSTRADPLALRAVAVMIAVPLPVAVSRPSSSMAATAALLVDHDTDNPGMAWPFASTTTAESRSVSPSAANVWGPSSGWIRTPAGTCRTSAITESARSSRAARMKAVPVATPVTRPAESTVTIEVSALDQDTSAPAIGRPFGSRTVAVTRTVSSSASRIRRSGGGIRTEWGRCCTATRAESFASPEVATMYASPLSTAVTSPA